MNVVMMKPVHGERILKRVMILILLILWSLHIPVLVINESSGSISPWLQYHATEIVDNVVDALELIHEEAGRAG